MAFTCSWQCTIIKNKALDIFVEVQALTKMQQHNNVLYIIQIQRGGICVCLFAREERTLK